MLVISMAASADPKIVDSAYRLQNLYDAGLGDYTEEHRDWKTARSAACALQRVARAKVDPSSAKYIILDLITERLVAVARGDWCQDESEADTNEWFCAAEQAINAIFTISPSPEKVAIEILLGHQAGIFGSPENPCNSANSLRLSRFFFVLGHIALKLLIYTEVLSSSVRRANAAKTVKKQESASGPKSSEDDAESKEDDEEEDAIEAELGIAAQAEAETERKVAEISENEIVGRGVISLFTPMLLRPRMPTFCLRSRIHILIFPSHRLEMTTINSSESLELMNKLQCWKRQQTDEGFILFGAANPSVVGGSNEYASLSTT